MINLRPDLTISKVLNAPRWCKSGHSIPEITDVYYVSGDSLSKDRWGNYCEHCVRIAYKVGAEARAKLKAEGKIPTDH